jgi:hypothetical protein
MPTYSIRIIVTQARADRLDLAPAGLAEARGLARMVSLTDTRCPVEVWRHEGAEHAVEARYENGRSVSLQEAV